MCIRDRAENVHGAELVVYTAAIMKGNPEIEEATGWVSLPWSAASFWACLLYTSRCV